MSSRLLLAAGAVAALAALPRVASAQLLGGSMHPGAVPATAQGSGPVLMRPGPIVRGGMPPAYGRGPVLPSGPVFGQAPVFSRHPSFGGGFNETASLSYSAPPYSGPVVVLPEAPQSVYGNGAYGYGSGSYGYGGGSYARPGYLPPVGPANGFFPNPIPPVGPANGFIPNPLPPVGPGTGFSNVVTGQPYPLHRHEYFYSNTGPVVLGEPPLLGGYYYGSYCDVRGLSGTYPSVYSVYDGFPRYIYSSNVTTGGDGYAPAYAAPAQTFNAPVYQTVYNQNNYYVASQGRVADLEAGGARAKEALRNAYPANSFQAAFADIAQAWTDGDLALLRRHLRDRDTRISVSISGKYAYSIASGDFSQITRDALDRLHTVSFDFTRLRRAKNGDVTAYGTHVYRAADAGSGADSGTMPFDQAGAEGIDQGGDLGGTEKTVYVSYTLRRTGGEWYIVAADSAASDLSVLSGG